MPPPDIQRTTFSIDAVARFVCNTWQEVEEAQKNSRPIDIVIVGSGMYGGYCAAKLFEFSDFLPPEDRPRILVLEAGPFLVSEHVQNLTRVGAIDGTVLRGLTDFAQHQGGVGFVPHHQCVGGKSLFWGGWTPRLTKADLDQWPTEAVEYLYRKGEADGYEYIEREIGTWPIADFINGELFDILKRRTVNLLEQQPQKVPDLRSAPLDPPIAVSGNSPGSGLFSMDKFSSLPLLLDAVRRDSEEAGGDDKKRRLFLVPYAEVLKLETTDSVVSQVVVALRNPADPENKRAARIERLTLSPGATVLLAGNTINSTRLALNSFPRPPRLEPNAELMGRNLMAHVRGNFFWRIRRDAIGVPANLRDELQTAALHVRGETQTSKGPGQFHFQFYATPSLTLAAFPGARDNVDEFIYRMIPSLDMIDMIRQAQEQGSIAIGIRTCGEMFGDKVTPVNTTNSNASWMSVTSGGGNQDDVYQENGAEVRIPKAVVRMVETAADTQVRQAQKVAAFQLIEALTDEPAGAAQNTMPGRAIERIPFKPESDGEDDVGTTYHESGTLWIGSDFRESVTDVNGRFHHVTNAGCIDQSLFPTVGSANPVPTGLALARKTARALIARRDRKSLQLPDEQLFQPLYAGNFRADGWTYTGPARPNSASAPRFQDLQVANAPAILEAGVRGNVGLGVLWFKEQFEDFVLRVEWQAFDLEANSGIFVRAPKPPDNLDNAGFYDAAVEVQIDERGFKFDPPNNSFLGSPLHRTGAVYELFPAQQWAAKALTPEGQNHPGYWNTFEITLSGAQIAVRLNGNLVSEGNLPATKGASNAALLEKGFIGFQCHTERVQFRNIRIRRQ